MDNSTMSTSTSSSDFFLEPDTKKLIADSGLSLKSVSDLRKKAVGGFNSFADDSGMSISDRAKGVAGINGSFSGLGEKPGLGDRLKDKNFMGNVAGLASTLMQAAALPTMLKNAKLQNKALSQNINTAKEEQARRNNMISSFNSFKGS